MEFKTLTDWHKYLVENHIDSISLIEKGKPSNSMIYTLFMDGVFLTSLWGFPTGRGYVDEFKDYKELLFRSLN